MSKKLVTDDDYLGVGLWPEEDEIPPTYEPQYLAAPVHLLSPQAILAWFRKHPATVPPVAPPATPGILANVGIFGFSDPGTNLVATHLPLAADYTGFTLTGQAATLTYGGGSPATYSLTADFGAFSLHGDAGPVMPAPPAIFTFDGQAANLVVISNALNTGAFTLTGIAANLTYVPAAGNNLTDANGSTIQDALGNAIRDAA